MTVDHSILKMSKLLSRKRKQDYESDDGFVEDAPKSKNPRKEPKQVNSAVQKDDDGNEYWEVSGSGHSILYTK